MIGGIQLDLAVAICGNGDVTYANASQLLDDYLPADCLVYVPNYGNSDGMKQVIKFLDTVGQPYDKVRRSELTGKIERSGVARKEIIVLGSDGLEDLIDFAVRNEWKVSDLTRGLFDPAVVSLTGTQMPLDGSESNAETITEAMGDTGTGLTQNEAQGSPRLSHDLINTLPPYVTRSEMEEYVRQIMTTHETHFHGTGSARPDQDKGDLIPADASSEVTGPASAEVPDGVKCYKNKKGTIRKAGKTKARPGETVVYLTAEESDAL